MMLMADDGAEFRSSGDADLGLDWGCDDTDMFDLDSLMSMLDENSNGNNTIDHHNQQQQQQQPVQTETLTCFVKDAPQGESAGMGNLLGNSDYRNPGSSPQITSPVLNGSEALKYCNPLDHNNKYYTDGEAHYGTFDGPYAVNSIYEGSGTSSESNTRDLDLSLHDGTHLQDNQHSNFLSDNSPWFSQQEYNFGPDGTFLFDPCSPYMSDSFDFQSVPSNENMITTTGRDGNLYMVKNEHGDTTTTNSQTRQSGVSEVDCKVHNENKEDIKFSVPMSEYSYPYSGSSLDGRTAQETKLSTYPSMASVGCKGLDEVYGDVASGVIHPNHDDIFSSTLDSKQHLHTMFSLHVKKVDDEMNKEKPFLLPFSSSKNFGQTRHSIDFSSFKTSPSDPTVTVGSQLLGPSRTDCFRSKVHSESLQRSPYTMKPLIDEHNDICIIEEFSKPPRANPPSVIPIYAGTPHLAPDGTSQTGVEGMRQKINDERLIYRVALQDLSQERTEMDPPEGVLAVPLLRHQKIALSWMVSKENNLQCSGGILADDQGLGKTISTIAVILKERSPSSNADHRQNSSVTVNLDGDDDDIVEIDRMDPNITSSQSMRRLSAGTLVVCPTSVLRQWADELRNKVTSKANLSVLVYHGSNRTKDPNELAKYDVVVTTYSIVSMEVPKQPLVYKEKDEDSLYPKDHEFSSSKKRKFSENLDNKPWKGKKGLDKSLVESAARPLARVNWFRVVLDEAQSIKNHKAQAARACWGLRAKRRWCLSGTPIQNAIDDLYSYFRFLRYEPYAIYKNFCFSIKAPVSKNPAKGYKKLQAVLKTIMLRRTKGTILDGEPIFHLPPKTIELRRVEFSPEERDFYIELEASCRAKFKVMEAAGTVQKNYVNILLMLLRLRQACDHPYLVKKSASGSVESSTVEDAKSVPVEKRTYLLSNLQGGLALCGICNDVPEDAVVSVCGHIFCSQCIYEHLIGDDSQCPKAACKVRLSTSLVFSKETLASSLSEQPAEVSAIDSPGSELVQPNEPTDPSYYSSKLRAAIEALQLLPKYSVVSKCNSVKSSVDGSGCSDNLKLKFTLKDKAVQSRDFNDTVKVVGEKAIVFSQWTGMLDLFELCLKNTSIQHRRLDGTMSVLARDRAVKDFNTIPEITVMIMSLKAASLGLNMVAANHVVMLDLWWNPTTEDQAIDRAHRIGQTRPVKVLRLTVNETVEDRILGLQQKKRAMVASAFGEDEKGGRQSRLTYDDLRYLFMV